MAFKRVIIWRVGPLSWLLAPILHMNTNRQNNFAITLPDYLRIFQTIHGVLLKEDCNPAHACLYFGVIGAAILKKHHRLKALPVVGMAAYRLNEHVLTFGKIEGNEIKATEDGFHCWIEINGVAIDFQAPLFKDLMAKYTPPVSVPRKMMQKRLDQASPSLESLATSGSHWYSPDISLHNSLLEHFISVPVNVDLTDICCKWYKPAPKKMLPAIKISNAHGQTQNIVLSPLRVESAW